MHISQLLATAGRDRIFASAMRVGRRVVPILPCEVKLRTFIERHFGNYASVALNTSASALGDDIALARRIHRRPSSSLREPALIGSRKRAIAFGGPCPTLIRRPSM